jgi:hypothetical protein
MGLISNLRSALKVRSRAEQERDYLDQSTSVIDLEMRQREIDRGRFKQSLRTAGL